MSIAAIESTQFLSEEQKHDIFFNNAARFLGLDTSEYLLGSSGKSFLIRFQHVRSNNFQA